jgi:hypothetical protein
MAASGEATAQVSGNMEQLYLYPHPLTLARDRAEAERVRLADSAAYSTMCATWVSLGGLTTFYRYGADYYRLLARRRWKKVSAEILAEYVQITKARQS